jgi:hypothetical protein
MIQQAAKYEPISKIYYQGFDLFDCQTGEQYRNELSKKSHPIEIVRKRLEATGANIELIAGDTRETIAEITDADLYFVDGGHSETTIENDAYEVLEWVEGDVIAVFDDYYHAGKPEGYGCNKVIDSLSPDDFIVTHLPVRTEASDGRIIGMVKVQRNNANISL